MAALPVSNLGKTLPDRAKKKKQQQQQTTIMTNYGFICFYS